MMGVYYILKDRENFEKTIDKLRSSSVRLSPTELEKLRFWLVESL